MPFKIPPIQGVICVFMLLMVTLPMNVVQVTAYFVLPRAVGRKISARLFQQAGYLMFMFSDYFSNVELVLYGDRIPEEESALLISNHLGAELVHFFQLAYRAKMLHALRFVQKDGLKWIPVNWTCYLHEHVFVKRGTANSRAESAKMMREKLCSFGEDKVPIWMVVFPEGTWVAGPEEQNLVDRSQAFAKKNNLAVYKNVLTPRTAGFCATVDGAAVSVAASEDSLAALYDITFAYDNQPPVLGKKMPPAVLEFLNGGKSAGAPKRLHIHIRRVSTSGARENHPLFSDAEAFLHKTFDAKEAMLDHFAEHKAFPGEARAEPSHNGRMILGFFLGVLPIIFSSFWVLYLISGLLLALYLGALAVLLVGCVAFVSWDEETGHKIGNDYKNLPLPPSPGKPSPGKQQQQEEEEDAEDDEAAAAAEGECAKKSLARKRSPKAHQAGPTRWGGGAGLLSEYGTSGDDY